jgi:hypothetical protein
MLDVLHYLLEEDTAVSSEHLATTRDRFRTNLYPDFFDKEYAFSHAGYENDKKSTRQQVPAGPDPQSYGNMAPLPGGPTYQRTLTPGGNHLSAAGAEQRMVHKPYIPPTSMDVGVAPDWAPIPGLKEAPML